MSIRALKWAANVMPLINLPAPERAILWALCYHHNDKSGDCFPDMETLSGWSGVADRRTRSAVKMLSEWGLIKAKRGASPSGNASNRYTLFGKPKMPKRTGRRVPVSNSLKPAQKSRFQTGIGGTVSNRQTGADDRGKDLYGEKDPTNVVNFAGMDAR